MDMSSVCSKARPPNVTNVSPIMNPSISIKIGSNNFLFELDYFFRNRTYFSQRQGILTVMLNLIMQQTISNLLYLSFSSKYLCKV